MKNILDIIEQVELDHFRTVHDTGANPNAMLIMNSLRRYANLPYIFIDDLPQWDAERKGYYMPLNSNLLCARKILARREGRI